MSIEDAPQFGSEANGDGMSTPEGLPEIVDYAKTVLQSGEVSNETALTYSVNGLYLPTNQVVLSVLDRLELNRKSDFEPPKDFERASGDFLSDADLMNLDELLKGEEDAKKAAHITRLFMINQHKKWAYRQRLFGRRQLPQ